MRADVGGASKTKVGGGSCTGKGVAARRCITTLGSVLLATGLFALLLTAAWAAPEAAQAKSKRAKLSTSWKVKGATIAINGRVRQVGLRKRARAASRVVLEQRVGTR